MFNLLGLLAPDPVDERDIKLEAVTPLKMDYPEIINFDEHTIISHQHYGTCTSHSSTGSDESQESKEYKTKTKLANKFVYLKTKELSGLYNDEGDYLRNGIKSLEKFGVPLESDFPDIRMTNWNEYVHTFIPKEVEEKALIHKIKGYARIGRRLEDFMSGMWTAQSQVPTGMVWYKSYKVGKDGYLPPADGKQIGGHAIRASIINFKEEKIWFPNSWSKNWGNNGYFYIPFNEWNKHNIWDCWVIYSLPNDWQNKIKSMHQRYIDKKTNEQYFRHDDIYWRIPDADTLHLLLERKWVTENTLEIPLGVTVKDLTLSVKAYNYIREGKNVFDDIFI